jgi:hypothetical protein
VILSSSHDDVGADVVLVSNRIFRFEIREVTCLFHPSSLEDFAERSGRLFDPFCLFKSTDMVDQVSSKGRAW